MPRNTKVIVPAPFAPEPTTAKAPSIRHKEPHLVWDCIVVGGGPAGANAAVVLTRAHRRVLLIDEGKQRNLLSTGMHNFLTRDAILPSDFLKAVSEELDHYSVPRSATRAIKAERLEDSGHFCVTTSDGKTHRARKLLLATGVTDNIPDVPGMKELWGCAVHHCAYCDGWECSHKTIGLYASEHNGFGMALALRQYSKDIILFTDGRKYLRARQRDELFHHQVRVVPGAISHLQYTERKIEAVVLKSGEEVCCGTMFVHHGYRTNNELLLQLGGRCSSRGAGIVNRKQECSIPGLYVAGDCALDAHFVIVAAAQGARSGIYINDALLQEDNAASLAINRALDAEQQQAKRGQKRRQGVALP